MNQSLGRRLATYVVSLLVLFFAVGGYIQSSRNGDQLDRAAKDRTTLINNSNLLLEKNTSQTNTIKNLRNALIQTNKELARLGLKTVDISKIFSESQHQAQSSPGPTSIIVPTKPIPTHKPTVKPTHKPTTTPTHKPTTSPTHKASPGPIPPTSILKQTQTTLCKTLGICIKGTNNDYQQQTVRQPEVYCPGRFTSMWDAIFCAISNLESA